MIFQRAARAVNEQRLFSGYGFGPYGATDPSKIPGPSDEWRGSAGPLVTELTALQHITVYACVSLIADATGQMPMHAFRPLAGGNGRQKLPAQPQVVANPDINGTPFDWKHRTVVSLLLRGNAFSWVSARDGRGVPTQLMPIHPDKVRKAEFDSDDGRPVYELVDGTRTGHVFDGGDLFHIPGFTLPGEALGISPIRMGMHGLSLSMAAEEFGARWFRDGAHPSGILHSDGEIGDEAAKRMQRRWIKTHGGRSRLPAILEGGLKWSPIQIPPEESQFLETRKFQTAEIARLFRVPPHMIADMDRSTSWGTGLEEQGLGFVVYTLGAWIARLEQALSELLPRPQFVKLNPAALLRGRTKDRFTAYAIGRQWGWFSVNDIRELEDMPPIEDGDVYLQPLNMIDAEQALKVLLEEDSR